jgi:hypothetical protein
MRQAPETQTVPSARDGAIRLNTGDNLIRVPGMESVVTPDGNGVVINTKNGESYLSVFGNAKVEHASANGSYEPVKPGSLPSGFT